MIPNKKVLHPISMFKNDAQVNIVLVPIRTIKDRLDDDSHNG